MSKSALVIETPYECKECVLCNGLECGITQTEVKDGKPDDCPLKEIPPRQVCNEYDFEHYQNGVLIGKNYIIDLLCGERDWKKDNRI